MRKADGAAVVGIGCRLPGGVHGPAHLARFLRDHGDGVIEVPHDRWSSDLHWHPDARVPGKTYVHRGAFLQQDLFSFDPEPFGISAKEAEQLDPQQRLLLEVTWEAFEDAGLPIQNVRGTNASVYIGGFTQDHQSIAYWPQNRHLISTHTSVGASMTLLSNRLSYTFDLRGPSMTVDTACSSSLVAAHLAFQSIVRGDCDLAVVGGVNVMMSPAVMVAMCKGQFLAADGRSKTFDAAADGYGRGEGAAVVVLKSLERAVREGDRIYAVIAASGVNQDGRTPGITLPSEEAQRSLCERVLRDSGLRSEDVAYVEAHGTGTRAGDPVEVRALGSVYGRGRKSPLLIGSAKTNIGHLEAAAGVVGLIKAALSLHNREVYPVRALGTPNQDIPFEELSIEIARRTSPWPGEHAAAAVNAFGYGGTNAHVILTPAPPSSNGDRAVTTRPIARELRLAPISASSRDALCAYARELAGSVDEPRWLDQLYTLARRRNHLPERACLVATSADELRDQLMKVASGDFADDRLIGRASGDPRLVWVLTGMGPQWWGMGQDLFREERAFREAVQEADGAFCAVAGWSILEQMMAGEQASRMSRNEVAQPANFVLQVGLVTLLRRLGVPCQGVIGHSVGEVAAAWAGGCLSLADAARVAFHRSRLQQRLAGHGTMLAVALSESELHAYMRDVRGVVVAAFNSARSLTLSGPREELERVANELSVRGAFNRFVPVEVAYHGPQMDPLQDEFLSSLRSLAPQPPRCPLYSTVYGAKVTGAVHDAAYWWANARNPVLLHRALKQSLDDGCGAYLEVGPHPVLATAIRDVMKEEQRTARTFHSLKRGQPESRCLHRSLADMYVHGIEIDWRALYEEGRLTEMPTYPFQRKRHWLESEASRELRVGRSGSRFSVSDDGPARRLVSDLNRSRFSYLWEHSIQGSSVFPAAAYIEWILAAFVESSGGRLDCALEDLSFERVLVMQREASPQLSIDVDPGGRVEVYARHDGRPWELHARGAIVTEPSRSALPSIRSEVTSGSMPDCEDLDAAYERLEAVGLAYGPSFRVLRSLRSSREGDIAQFVAALDDSAADARGCFHPPLLDGAFQAALLVAGRPVRAAVPVSVDRVRWSATGRPAKWARGQVAREPDGAIRADVALLDENGSVVLDARGVVCRLFAVDEGEAVTDGPPSYVSRWEPRSWPRSDSPRSEVWALAGGSRVFLERLRRELDRRGIRTKHVRPEDGDAPLHGCARLVVAHQIDDDPAGLDLCNWFLRVVQAAVVKPLPLRVVTFGACDVADDDQANPAQATLWGFGRVLMTEHPEMRGRLLDLPRIGAVSDADVVSWLADDSVDEECAVRDGVPYVHRYVPAPPDVPVGQSRPAAYSGRYAIEPMPEGNGLRVAPRPARPLEGSQIEVDVVHAILAVDRLAQPASSRAIVASVQRQPRSVVGRVSRVGPTAHRVSAGELVQFICDGEVASHLSIDEAVAVPVSNSHAPRDALGYADFFLAWHALVHVARARSGDRVAVDDASDPLGSAVVQVARLLGAQVLAVAADIGDVDIVLVTSTDRARLRTGELLAPGGRLVIIRHAANALELERVRLRPGRALHCIDLEGWTALPAGERRPVVKHVLSAFADGALTPPPVRGVAVSEIVAHPARLGAAIEHGRLALDFASDDTAGDAAAEPQLLRSDRTYLVTGGLGGFGLATAEWLVEQGARAVVLGGRRGSVGQDGRDRLERMRRLGARIECRTLDVTDEASVDDVLHFVQTSLPPLAGIFHCAMVLEDQPIASLRPDALRRAMGAKAYGAWLLHEKTRGDRLDHFVLYSSVSAIVGNPNQAAYAAANAYLEALANARRRAGLPAVCISWGAIDDVGVVAQQESTKAHLRRLGIRAIPVDGALSALGAAMRSARPCTAVVDIDWDVWVRSFPQTSWTRLSPLVGRGAAESPTLVRLRAELADMEAPERAARLFELVRGAAGRVLGRDTARIDADAQLSTYGLDSLLAVELQVEIEQRCGVAVPTIQLVAGASVAELCQRISDSLSGGVNGAKSVTVPPELPADLREEFLSRICVQPPYFDLFDMRVDGSWVEASARPVPAAEDDDDPISCAEVARHLAILGSCAASRRNPALGRTYYPVVRACYSQTDRSTARAELTETVRLRARCIAFDLSASVASCEAELLDSSGEVVATLLVDYHVIPADAFERLFASRRTATREDSGLNPYGSWPQAECVHHEDGSVSFELVVEPDMCLGHFVGFPALPVSIMTRYAIRLVAQAGGHATRRISVRSGLVETKSFLFARSTATFTAHKLRRDSTSGGELWECVVRSGEQVMVKFELNVITRHVHVSEVRRIKQGAATVRAPAHRSFATSSRAKPDRGAIGSSGRRHKAKSRGR